MAAPSVTVHLDMLCRNDAGTVFGNVDENVIALRWQSLADESLAVAAVDLACDELALSGVNTLIYDTRLVSEAEGSARDTLLRISVLTPGAVRQVGWIVSDASFVLPQEVADVLQARDISSCIGTSFEEVAQQLVAMPECHGNLLSEAIANFAANYGGSCYSVPELRTTVLRTAGNFYEFEPAGEIYQASFELHLRTRAIAFIVDSSAVAPIHNVERYSFGIERLILPLSRPGMVQQLVHVRSGDILIPGVCTLQELSTALNGIEVSEADSVQKGLDIIRMTQGRKPLVPPTKKTAATT